MADFIIVDTDILIDAGRGIIPAVECLQHIEAGSSLAVSVVTQMELIVGCRNKTELQNLDRFLRRFKLLKLTEHESQAAIELFETIQAESRLADSRCVDCRRGSNVERGIHLEEPA